jgi:hypothetical protein
MNDRPDRRESGTSRSGEEFAEPLEVVVGDARLGIRVEMIERARLDFGSGNESVHFMFSKADHTPKLVRRDATFVNELVQRAQRNAQAIGGLICAQPTLVSGSHRDTLHISSQPFTYLFDHSLAAPRGMR